VGVAVVPALKKGSFTTIVSVCAMAVDVVKVYVNWEATPPTGALMAILLVKSATAPRARHVASMAARPNASRISLETNP
jgi:hypothetical protein